MDCDDKNCSEAGPDSPAARDTPDSPHETSVLYKKRGVAVAVYGQSGRLCQRHGVPLRSAGLRIEAVQLERLTAAAYLQIELASAHAAIVLDNQTHESWPSTPELS